MTGSYNSYYILLLLLLVLLELLTIIFPSRFLVRTLVCIILVLVLRPCPHSLSPLPQARLGRQHVCSAGRLQQLQRAAQTQDQLIPHQGRGRPSPVNSCCFICSLSSVCFPRFVHTFMVMSNDNHNDKSSCFSLPIVLPFHFADRKRAPRRP